ncbi:MAG: hypothetical protein Q9195_007948 [Heterodermia aff. obscurata]
MNPSHYLHLPDQKVDIRGSQIALHFRYTNRGQVIILAVNFIDGRWPRIVQEPEKNIKEILQNDLQGGIIADPFFIQHVYLISIMRWWTNALNSIHEQLVAYEVRLQDDQQEVQNSSLPPYQEISRALHAIAAHLHRYTSELTSIEDTKVAIIKLHQSNLLNTDTQISGPSFGRVEDGFDNIGAQLKVAKDSVLEFEKKVQNILALLFSRIQLSNDRIMVTNGLAMQDIMKATQLEAKISQEMAKKTQKLSESMRQDSLSMKTVSIFLKD